MKRLTPLLMLAVGTFVILGVGGCHILGIGNQLYYNNDEGGTITGVGYDEGAGPFTVPTGRGTCSGANVHIDAENLSASAKTIALMLSPGPTTGSDIAFTLQPGEELRGTFLIRLDGVEEGTNLRLWHNPDDGAADLTDVSIYGEVTYWLFNVVSVN